MTPDVNVIVLDFKGAKEKEMVTENEDGSYTIFINARLSHTGQLKAYEHAMRHIDNEDFQKTDIQTIEYVAHELPADTAPEPAQKYFQRIKRLQAERRRIKRQIERDKQRVQFIRDNCDMFQRAEHNYLYGDDL